MDSNGNVFFSLNLAFEIYSCFIIHFNFIFHCSIVFHYRNNTPRNLIWSHIYLKILSSKFLSLVLIFPLSSRLLYSPVCATSLICYYKNLKFNDQKIILDFFFFLFPICSLFSIPCLPMTPFTLLCRKQNQDGNTLSFMLRYKQEDRLT